jgi:hypothetical protein
MKPSSIEGLPGHRWLRGTCTPACKRKGLPHMVPHYRNYRIYLLDVSDHFLAAKDVVCETDQEAFAQAADLIGSHAGAELWEQTRLVGRLG